MASSKVGNVGVGPFPSLRRFRPPVLSWPATLTLSGLREAVLKERDRWALWLPAALAAGIGLYFLLPVEPTFLLAAPLGFAGLLIAIAAAGSDRPWPRLFLGLLAASLIGFSVAKLRTDTLDAPVLSYRIGPVPIEGRIENAEAHGEGTRMMLSNLSIARLAADRTPARIRISQRYGTEPLVPGTWVQVTAVLLPPPEPSAPADYDFARWAFFEQIGAVGYVYGKPRAIAPPRPNTWREELSAQVQDLRDAMTARIASVIPGENGAISAALITGERGAISQDAQDAFRDSGLAHVLSISGLHLALAGGFFFWIVRALLALVPAIALNYPIKKWAAAAALLGATFYLIVSGMGAPPERSYIMLFMMFTAILVDRPAISMRSVALAAALILLFAPESLVDPGFEMSFASVIGLIALAEWQRARQARRESGLPRTIFAKIGFYVLAGIVTSIVATLATAPFAIFHFDRASQFGLLGNLLAEPVIGIVIMPAATVAMILMPFGLDRLPLIVMGKGVGLMLAIAQWVAQLPGAASVVPVWPAWAVIAAAAGGLWIALWRKEWRWLGLAPVAIAVIGALLTRPPDLLISQDAKTVAVRIADGRLAFLREPTDDYAAENWLKRDGDSRDPFDAVGKPQEGVRCDDNGCIAKAQSGDLVAAVTRDDALSEDCSRVAIVVSAVAVRDRCNGPRLIIDRFDLATNGATAVWLGGDLRVETAQAARGERPWSRKSKPDQ
ncbi:MAG: ComEC/Rec2 family competence protein [Proteobacteria bacterium]|nr:ComEC/Rec2 family competence protein [Pseudomonadota bacterium]